MDINKVYCEDNLVTMGNMPDEFVDLTVTSPPYDDIRNYKGFSFQFEKMAVELYRITKIGGVVVWVVNDSTVDGKETLTSCRQKIFFSDVCGFNIHDTMIYVNGARYPDKTRYSACFEYMIILSKGKPKSFNPIKDRKNRWLFSFGTTSERLKNGDIKDRKKLTFNDYGIRWNIWKYNTGGLGNTTTDEIALGHPAVFPEQLAADHIHSWSNKGDLIYDPFMGSGTTAKMAHLQGRNWIGSEISQEYCDIANKRIAPYLQQTNMFH